MDKREEILRIIDQLNLTYEGEEAWHGPSVVETLAEVTWEMANQKVMPGTHTIAELVFHATSWRIFCVRKLQGDADFDINEKTDWKVFKRFDDIEWEGLQMELSLSQHELISELENLQDDELLDETVPGRQYDYYTMLHGIIQHDLYHTGQISILKKALIYKGFGNKKAATDEFGDDFDGLDDY